jgi:hypothetical protein
MGEVYRARDPRLDRQVAIKLLPSELAADPHARKRLRREAMAVAAIDHPYISGFSKLANTAASSSAAIVAAPPAASAPGMWKRLAWSAAAIALVLVGHATSAR